MPVYEYLVEHCDGPNKGQGSGACIFECVKSMRESNEPQPCPECDAEGKRIPPSSFTAFVWRKGYPRRIPDKGTYWHLGQEVSYLPSKARAYEHPQIKKEPRQGPLGKQDYEELVDHKIAERRAKREVRRAELDRKREARVRKSVKRWKDD